MPLYVSDYLADTSHLSAEEHGAYLLLLMHAWMNGGELPLDDNRLRRICRMDERPWKASKDEIKAFFYEQDGVLRHHRVDRELERAQHLVNQRSAAGKASAAKRKSERESQRDGNERSTSVATSVAADEQREAQRNGKPPPSPTPTTSHSYSAEVDVTGVGRSAGVVCARLKSAGILDVNPSHPRLIALLDAGLSVEEIAGIGPEARKKGKGFAWVLATAEGRRRDAAATQPLPAKGEPPWWSSNERMLAKGRTLGMSPRPGEDWPAFRERIHQRLAAGQAPPAAA